MEKEKINIAALLKDCPKGTKLYSPICGECEFKRLEDTDIYINCPHSGWLLNQYGHMVEDRKLEGECLLFPSKDNRDWSTFKAPKPEEPRFKVGDVVIRHDGNLADMLVVNKDPLIGEATGYNVVVNDMEKYNCTLATPEEIAEWNEETLHPNHLHYSKSRRKIIPWFLPFDRVVGRCKYNDILEVWSAGLFSHYDKETNPIYPYQTIAGMCNECLPYNEDTAKLIGTTDDYKEGIK